MMILLKKIWSARVYWLILGLGILVQALAIRAEDAQSFLDSQTVIRVSSNLVAVPVSVTDAAGQAVSDLGIDDFKIQEEGRVETISKIADAGESPLQMALLFDLSGSLNSRFEFEQQAAIRFLEKVWKQGDSVTIIAFNEQPQISIRNCRSLPEALNALTNLRPTESSTAFYDSVIMASDILHQSAVPETRRSVIVLSDGEDNRSDRTAADALHEFQQIDAIFYSINPSGPSIRLNEISEKGQEYMASIAAETGGTAFVSDMGGNLEQVFTRIANELRAQYLLSYYSSHPYSDNRFRRIAVSIPERPDLRVRARQGYFAVPR
jgi:Ca-activated chloride channel homolog